VAALLHRLPVAAVSAHDHGHLPCCARDRRTGKGCMLLLRQAEDLAQATTHNDHEGLAAAPPQPLHVVAQPV
jgi:hypothetical protein